MSHSFLFNREKIMIRDDITAALVAAMKGGDKPKTATIRLIQAAIKNRDIEARTGKAPTDDDLFVTEVMQKMVKQRRESIDLYVKGGRQELADIEAAEIVIIEAFVSKRRAEANPYGEGATTLEWQVASPPPYHTFDELPKVK